MVLFKLQEGRSGYTALHFACVNNNEQLAQFLMYDCRSNLEIRTYGLLTAYQLAAENENRIIMENLQRCGAKLLSPPESDDDYFFDSSEEDYFDSDECELN